MRRRTWRPPDRPATSGIADDEVGKRGQVGTECAGPESDDTLADLDRIDIAADCGHDTDALAADHRRTAVQPGVYPHGLEHVAEVESRGADPDLDLAGLGGIRLTACTVSASSRPG